MNTLDWDLYGRLKAEGRLNVLLRLSEPCASWLQNTSVPADRSNVVPFISRAIHLEWRKHWQRGRFVKLAWSTEERAAIVRQDELFRKADLEWERRHPARAGLAVVILFRQ